MNKQWRIKLFALCSLLIVSNGIRAVDADLKKATYGMGLVGLALVYFSDSNTEKIARGAYCGAITAYIASLLYSKELNELEKIISFIGIIWPAVALVAGVEIFLENRNQRLKSDFICFNFDSKLKARPLVKDYQQLEVSYAKPEIYGDCSELIVKISQEINAINAKDLAHDCSQLNKLIKKVTVKNYSDKYISLFSELVEHYRVLKEIKEENGHQAIRDCLKLMKIEQIYAQELINPQDGVAIMKVVFLQKQIGCEKQKTFDQYLQALAQDCECIEKIQESLAETCHYKLCSRVSEVLNKLRVLEDTVKTILIDK